MKPTKTFKVNDPKRIFKNVKLSDPSDIKVHSPNETKLIKE
jgi:hypothetical protein